MLKKKTMVKNLLSAGIETNKGEYGDWEQLDGEG